MSHTDQVKLEGVTEATSPLTAAMSEGKAFNASVPARPILSQSGTSSRLYFLDIGELADGDYEVALVTARQLQRLKDILNSIEIDTNE